MSPKLSIKIRREGGRRGGRSYQYSTDIINGKESLTVTRGREGTYMKRVSPKT